MSFCISPLTFPMRFNLAFFLYKLVITLIKEVFFIGFDLQIFNILFLKFFLVDFIKIFTTSSI